MSSINTQQGVFRFLWGYVWKYRRYSFWVMFFVMMSAALSVAVPYAYKLYIDSFTGVQPPIDGLFVVKAIGYTLVAYIIATFLESLFFEIATFFYMPFLSRAMLDVLSEAYDKIMRLSYRFHSSQSAGKVYAMMARGEKGIEGIADAFVFSMIPLMFRIPFLLVTVAVVQGWVVVAVAVPIVLLLVWIVYSTHRIQEKEAKLKEDEDDMSGLILDSLTNYESIKAFGGASYRRFMLDEKMDSLTSKRIRTWSLYPAVYAVTGVIVTFGFGVVFVVATYSVLRGAFTVGDIAFLGASLGSLTSTLYYLSHRYARLRQTMTEFQRYLVLLSEEEDITDPSDPRPAVQFSEGVALDHVSFSYRDEEGDQALCDVTLRIPKGETTALVGHSGSGKSTLIRLLLRFYDVHQGAITVDGVDVRAMRQSDLHTLTSLVPQDPSMFHDTVYTNILFGRPDATREDVLDAARRASAHEFIERLENGYDTIVGDRGVKLSGGQRQRVAIARAILAARPIVLLDEATSSLDSVSELAIQKGLSELRKDTTMVVVAHRLSTVQHADNIVVLDDGRLIDQGTHSELLGRCAIYKELWDLQVGGFLAA